MSTGLKIALAVTALIIVGIIIAVLIWYMIYEKPKQVLDGASQLPTCTSTLTEAGTPCIPSRGTPPTSNVTNTMTGTDSAGNPTTTTFYEDGSKTVVTTLPDGSYSTQHFDADGNLIS
jgi:hypothetical protein